jgi:hypothetical protein
VLTDKDYDALRKKLKDAGSPVVLHEAPQFKVECGEGVSGGNGRPGERNTGRWGGGGIALRGI